LSRAFNPVFRRWNYFAYRRFYERSFGAFYIARKNLKDLLDELSSRFDQIVYLREDGIDIREVACSLKDPLFILGDHIGIKEEDEKVVLEYANLIVSLSPLSLQADQCIVIAHYELDRCSRISESKGQGESSP